MLGDVADEAEQLAALRLTAIKGLGPRAHAALIAGFGTAGAALAASPEDWAAIAGLTGGRLSRWHQDAHGPDACRVAEQRIVATREVGAQLRVLSEPAYPASLKVFADAPPVLWVRGELTPRDACALGVVGARKCSHYGREQAERFGSAAADAGLTVVSGGAYGIDAAAHRGALRVNGRTVVVLGCGVDVVYPKPHAGLFDDVLAGGGAVVSELPPGTPPHHTQFLPRNRVIVGLSLGVLVVEAAMRSGALNTARRCVEEGRPAMYLPGRVDSPASAGCHAMIRKGEGVLVQSIADVLEELGDHATLLDGLDERAARAVSGASADAAPPALFAQTATDAQRALVEALAVERSLDELIAVTGLQAAAVTSELTMLEVRGVVQRRGGVFQLKR